MATGLFPSIGHFISRPAKAVGGWFEHAGEDVARGTISASKPIEQQAQGLATADNFPTGQTVTDPGTGHYPYQQFNFFNDILKGLYNNDPNRPQQAPFPPLRSTTKATTPTQPPEPLTFQQIANKVFNPMINSLSSPTDTAYFQSLAAHPPSPSSLPAEIATTLHNSAQDYQLGLRGLLHAVSTLEPTQALLKGMEAMLAYPTSTSAAQPAPAATDQANFLSQLYLQLAAERTGATPGVFNPLPPSSPGATNPASAAAQAAQASTTPTPSPSYSQDTLTQNILNHTGGF